MGFRVKAVAPGFAGHLREVGEVFEIDDEKCIAFVKARKSKWLVPAGKAPKEGQEPTEVADDPMV